MLGSFIILLKSLLLFGPSGVIRIIKDGEQMVGDFRRLYGREPYEHEWVKMSRLVGYKVLSKEKRT